MVFELCYQASEAHHVLYCSVSDGVASGLVQVTETSGISVLI